MTADRWFRVTMAMLAAAVALLMVSAARAFTITRIGAERISPATVEPLREIPRARALPDSLLVFVAGYDPFRPERTRAPRREAEPDDAVAAPLIEPADVQLLGTVVLGDGGLAMVQWHNEAPRLVRVGHRIGSLTLRRVERGRAFLVDDNGSPLEIRVAQPGEPANGGR